MTACCRQTTFDPIKYILKTYPTCIYYITGIVPPLLPYLIGAWHYFECFNEGGSLCFFVIDKSCSMLFQITTSSNRDFFCYFAYWPLQTYCEKCFCQIKK